MAIAFICLGSNLGNRKENIDQALSEISSKCKLIKRSSLYETSPKYVQNQPAFLNIVAKIDTQLPPIKLLEFLQTIEKKLGRAREKEVRYGPRLIDLDILLYDQENFQEENLIIPHPRINERAFVLIPLYEIDKKPWIKMLLDKLPISEKQGVKKIA